MQETRESSYGAIFRNPSFRRFWLGFTFSVLGDALTQVALTWFVYQQTQSARALGLLTLAYTGPVIVGGLIAGSLLDRFDRRKVMFADNMIRGTTMALIPLLHLLGMLQLWMVYAAAAVYGSLMMISLAGGPTLIPSMVSEEQLSTANSLETLSFTLGGMIGPPLAGLLIALIGAPNVIALDALTYFVFAIALLTLRLHEDESSPEERPPTSYTLADAFRLLTGNSILLSTTLMYMTFNIGMGLFTVWMPIYADQILRGGSQVYGLLLGIMAAGQVISSIVAGNLSGLSLGRSIVIAGMLAGISMALLLGRTLWWAIAGLALFGFFSAPLTIWAQTLRMKIIPAPLRGRTFALLRMLMQGTTPLGGVVGGLIVPLAGVVAMAGISASLMGGAGLAGSFVKDLRDAGSPSPTTQLEVSG